MQDHVAAQYVYIADNVIKDFIAPKRLGWKTLGVSRYAQQMSPPSPQHAPDRWISSFQEVPPLLC
jgi:putative hydrolase of the HAD superfamily